MSQGYQVVSGGSNTLLTGKHKLLCDRLLPQSLQFDGNCVVVSAGVNIGYLIWQAAQRNLGGLEFLAGIPATVGGLVKMNAGAYGKTICPLVEAAYITAKDGCQKTITSFDYSYRHTDLSGYIHRLRLRLTPKPTKKIKATIDKNIAKRVSSQPLKLPNLGCIFANPSPTVPAGKLIDEARLKGTQIGGAKISPKHANFIVNTGTATAKDVLALIELVQTEVAAKFKTNLTLEIKIL